MADDNKEYLGRTNHRDYARETATGNAGMVVTAHPIATDIGRKILKDGGNAVDAAIAIQFALNIAEPMMTGIGGSGFMMIYDKDSDKIKIFDGHVRAPEAAHPEMFLDNNKEVIPFKKRSTHASAVGVPGILKAMDEARKAYGTKPLAELIEPSIEFAEKGVSANWVLSEALENFHYRLGDEAQSIFIPNGRRIQEGEIFKKENLAHTYRILQKEGIAAFYEGEIGEGIVKAITDLGGFMKLTDLANYRITVDEPVWGSYKDFKIASSYAPSAGGFALIQLMKILEGFHLEQYDVRSWEKYYLISEAMRMVFTDKKAFFADPEFADLPLKGLLHEDYLAGRRKLIDFKTRNPKIDFGNPWKYDTVKPWEVIRQPEDPELSETTHFTVQDRWGNIVACTSTVEHPFGSGIMVPEYGFMLNNELTDFDSVPGGMNQVEPEKRPVSFKSPTIIFKNDLPVLTLGSPGGPTILSSVSQTIINVIDYNMNLKDAIEEPRIFTPMGPHIEWEKGMDMQSKGHLESMGFAFNDVPHIIGNVQGIQIDPDNGTLFGAADSSREGKATGLNEEDYDN
ncbi:gamma-glutamyltransferase [Peribacillus cavernae]|uniref:Glutathione hydrolase proenzyme n=1 Tax=Peribacillus cavernae TaxID=1674310 RepID=A0A433HKK6_9BACI|nr:gamma-glutamyltransferase [Peribacillus cavernae]MDQ0217981.1 gamma-glutamyltranspeptidase/glutathione hydrolase [Peribacillus cavernae]RUQ28971.1 gamma-glutamyltransferase [Peribacillus cavernae]